MLSILLVAKARRGVVAAAAAAGLALGVAGCGGGGGGGKPDASASAPKGGEPGGSTRDERPRARLAELRGPRGLLLRITSAERDPGGFLTVHGQFMNEGPTSLVIPAELRGDETAILRHGSSLGGATLVDPKGKKRYYVLRDTEGRPLTTTGLTTIGAGRTAPVFMQFPAPPSSADRVTLQLPTFAAGTLKISG